MLKKPQPYTFDAIHLYFAGLAGIRSVYNTVLNCTGKNSCLCISSGKPFRWGGLFIYAHKGVGKIQNYLLYCKCLLMEIYNEMIIC